MNFNLSKIYSTTRHRRNERGIALISVLWVLLLLSALAATSAYVTRTNAILVHRDLEMAQAEVYADAAVAATISLLADARPKRHPRIDGIAKSWLYEGVPVTVSVSNEAGRVDVNEADDDLILAFLISQGIDQNAASRLLEDLRHWQDTDNDSTARDDEIGQNSAVARTATLRGRPLAAIEQLNQIPSWAAHNISCWLPEFTVFTGLSGVSVNDAGPQTLRALQWADAHSLGGRKWTTSVAPPIGEHFVLPEVVRVVANATVSKDVSATAVWVGRIGGEHDHPVLTMHWDHRPAPDSSLCKDPGAIAK
jgi:general secretion pathway protein K